MPFKPRTPCRHPGCAELTHDRYCEKHAKAIAKQYNTHERDRTAAGFYSKDVRWLDVRKKKLNNNPFCEECVNHGKFREATTVDHIKPIRHGGDRYAWDNLQSLCTSCHSRKSAREGSRWGKRPNGRQGEV